MRNKIQYDFFGSSHGEYVGAVLRGLPCGIRIDDEKLKAFMQRRRSGQNVYSTARREPDEVNFISGVENGLTTGEDVVVKIYNKDVRRDEYKQYKRFPRPSHADYVAWVKYGDGYDGSGGGQFSGRMTAAMCAAGGIALQLLERSGVQVCAYIRSVGRIKGKGYFTGANESEIRSAHFEEFPAIGDSERAEMLAAIAEARSCGDSLGGVVECCVFGLPAGIGEPMVGGVESGISKNIFAIPGVKGVEFGLGGEISTLPGSQANDEFYFDGDTVKTYTNNSGGINGGLSNGMPIVLRVAFRPTPSIGLEQRTVDLERKENATVTVKGRHDACFVPRAVPVVEALVALSLLELIPLKDAGVETVSSLRAEINRMDGDIIALLDRRMSVAKKIGSVKAEIGTAVYDGRREAEIFGRISELSSAENADVIKSVYSRIFSESRARQSVGKAALLGKPLGHSYSKIIHGKLGLDYELKEVEAVDLEWVLKSNGYLGFNVTLPYKKEIIKHLDGLDGIAEEIGAVNTVKVSNKALIGYNTDLFGLEYMLKRECVELKDKRVVVLGSGGASLTACAACRRAGAKEVTVVSRTGGVNYSNCYGKTDVLINTTPVGMYPDEQLIVELERFTGLSSVVDIIYNPIRTRLVCCARELGIKAVGGLRMLVAQAVKSYEIFTDRTLASDTIEKLYSSILREKGGICLVGMPSAGKTEIGKALAKELNMPFVDTDAVIEETVGRSPAEIITEDGEERFRRIEKAVIGQTFSKSGVVVATGGGAVLSGENRYQMSKNSLVIHVERPLRLLKSDGRPLSETAEKIAGLERQRIKIYRDLADFSVMNDGEISDAVSRIKEFLIGR